MHFFKIRYLIYIFIFPFCFCGCDSPQEVNREYTYFGGEIVNPNTDYVVLSKGDSYDDTIYIDKNNRFFHKIENLKDGLYSFKHNPETQLVILEKGDSVLIRLNTIEFDESLVFTGDGSRKNNFLIDMFLQNELEREVIGKRDYKLTPARFKAKQDSLLHLRNDRFDKFTDKYELSDFSKKVCKSSFEYDFHSRYEMYFYQYQYYGLDNLDAFKELPKLFFDYRNQVDFNNDDLKRLYSYNRFLSHYFTNASYTNYLKEKSFPKDEMGYTIYKLNFIDSLIQHSYIKNNLLRGISAKFLLDSKSDYASKKVLKHYLSVSTNNKFKKELKRLAWATSRLKPNRIIPDQDIISSDGELMKLSSLFEKPVTALYFWSTENKDHYVKAHKKTSYLSNLYPEIDFIGINTDNDQTNNWLKTIKLHKYDPNREYEFKYPKCSAEELVIHYRNYRNKVILVDQDGRIINSSADLFSTAFEKQLMGYTRLAILEKNMQ